MQECLKKLMFHILLPKINDVDMKSSHGAKAVVLEYSMCFVGVMDECYT